MTFSKLLTAVFFIFIKNNFLLFLQAFIFVLLAGTAGKASADQAQDQFAQAIQGVQDEKAVLKQLPPLIAEKKEITADYAVVDKAIEQNNTENYQIKSEIDQFNASTSPSDSDRAALNEKRDANLKRAADLEAQKDALDAREQSRMEKAADLARQYKAIQAHEKHIFNALAKLNIFNGNVQDCLKLGTNEAIVQCMESHWDGANPNPSGSMAGGTGMSANVSNLDTSVVDARDVPTGLPKSVENEIPHTPAGGCVRKGFEAIQTHDWKVALAWFQYASNKEPDNPDLKRLVDLAQYTLQRESQTGTSPSTDADTSKTLQNTYKALDTKQNEDLNTALNDFYTNYLPKHPELTNPPASSAADQKNDDSVSPAPASACWKCLYDYLFSTPSKGPKRPGSVAAVRD